MTINTYRCINTQCRIETFKGASAMPLNVCPVCLSMGTIVAGPDFKPVPANTDIAEKRA